MRLRLERSPALSKDVWLPHRPRARLADAHGHFHAARAGEFPRGAQRLGASPADDAQGDGARAHARRPAGRGAQGIGKIGDNELSAGIMTDSAFRVLDDLVYREICRILTDLGYELTRASRTREFPPQHAEDGGGDDDVGMLATNLSLKEGHHSDEISIETLRATWLGAVVAGINQARPIPSGGKCCCLGTATGLLLSSLSFADFGSVVGVDADASLHDRAVLNHHKFEESFGEKCLDTGAPRPVEIIFARTAALRPIRCTRCARLMLSS